MKNIWNLFWVETKRTVGSATFFALILAVVAMCFLIPIMLGDGRTMTNCLSAFFTMPKEQFRADYSLSVSGIMMQIMSGYFVMFAPMFVSIGILPILCEEKESGVYRLMLVRSGKKQESVGGFLACVACGGLLMAVGYLLFAGILGVHSYVLFGSAGMHVIKDTAISVLREVLEVLLYGMKCAVWTYFTAIFVRNRYLLACIPYIFLWLLQRFASNVEWDSIMENFGLRIFELTFNALFGGGILEYILQSAAVYGVIGIFVILLHRAVLQRRTDCGA